MFMESCLEVGVPLLKIPSHGSLHLLYDCRFRFNRFQSVDQCVLVGFNYWQCGGLLLGHLVCSMGFSTLTTSSAVVTSDSVSVQRSFSVFLTSLMSRATQMAGWCARNLSNMSCALFHLLLNKNKKLYLKTYSVLHIMDAQNAALNLWQNKLVINFLSFVFS